MNDITTVSFARGWFNALVAHLGQRKIRDSARGITAGRESALRGGKHPWPGRFANVLILAYDATNGTLLNTIQYSSGPGHFGIWLSIVTDAPGIST